MDWINQKGELERADINKTETRIKKAISTANVDSLWVKSIDKLLANEQNKNSGRSDLPI